MKTLTPTLLAAQQSPARTPFVSATVHDFEQGIQRLHWTRIYTGTEPDNHHGIAFDGEGSMHRIRVDTGRTLMRLLGDAEPAIVASVGPNRFWTDRFTAVATGQMDRFRLRCSAAGNVKVAIYADHNNAPGALLNAVNVAQAVVVGWNNIPFPPTPITAGTVYWLAFNSSATIVGRHALAGSLKRSRAETFAPFTFPNPAGTLPDSAIDVPDLIAGWQVASAASLLFYQKLPFPLGIPPSFPMTFPIPIVNPGALDQWTEIASDCTGPCAIAASGSRVYIFYRTAANVLWRRHSHDHGATWTSAQLATYTEVASLAACWWGTTVNVVCVGIRATTPAQFLIAVILNTDTLAVTLHQWQDGARPLLATWGIGCTHDPTFNNISIVLAGRQSATPYNHFNLFRTWLSDPPAFGALDSFLMAPEGELTSYEYPDCHLASSPQPHESHRITAVERFTGVTAYTRPLGCHMVRGTTWPDTTFTEPRPLLPLASSFGLRVQSTPAFYWMARPDGIWRAPRPALPPLDISRDILELSCSASLQARAHPALTITLDNSRGQYNNAGGLGAEPPASLLRFRSEIQLRLGYRTTAGPETIDAGHFWIDSWEYSSTPNQSLFTIHCLDGSGLLDRWSARFPMRWNQDATAPRSVWQILYTLLARVGICLTNTPTQPQSPAINNFLPDFVIRPGEGGDTAMRRLLAFVPDGLVFRDQQAFTKDPRPTEAPSYSYVAPAQAGVSGHPILSGAYADAVTLSRSRALGRASDGSRLVQEALDWALIPLADILHSQHDPNLTSPIRAQERADAVLREASLRAKRGNLVIPANVGQEPLDVVTITDARVGLANARYRVLAIRTDFDRRKGNFDQRLTLAAP